MNIEEKREYCKDWKLADSLINIKSVDQHAPGMNFSIYKIDETVTDAAKDKYTLVFYPVSGCGWEKKLSINEVDSFKNRTQAYREEKETKNIDENTDYCKNWQIHDDLVNIKLFGMHDPGMRFRINNITQVDDNINNMVFHLGYYPRAGVQVHITITPITASSFKNLSLLAREKEANKQKQVPKPAPVKSLSITVLIGLSGSGKSTWAMEQVKDSQGKIVNITKDDLRAMFYGHEKNTDSNTSKAKEKFILSIRDELVAQAINNGQSVIISDTNLNPIHLETMNQISRVLSNDTRKVNVKVKSFMNVPIEVCIKRDLKRQHSVGEQVIRKQLKSYNRYHNISPETNSEIFQPRLHNPTLPTAVTCDLDGTLALFKDVLLMHIDGTPVYETLRGPYDASKCDMDKINEPVATLLLEKLDNYAKIVFVSGRNEKYRPQTQEFLKKHLGWTENVEYTLFMRPDGDFRKDSILKTEIFERDIFPNYNVEFHLDDRQQVVDAIRKLGVNVFQVAPGNF